MQFVADSDTTAPPKDKAKAAEISAMYGRNTNRGWGNRPPLAPSGLNSPAQLQLELPSAAQPDGCSELVSLQLSCSTAARAGRLWLTLRFVPVKSL